jgi:cytoskeleton protein RodZ
MTISIGRELAQARQERGLKLEQIAHETHIRLHYLEALESGELHKLPSRVQAKGFLRAYAAYLGIPPEPLLAAFDNKPVKSTAVQQVQPKQPTKNGDLPSEQEKAIFEQIGQELQRQRELLGLSIEDVTRHTHLRDHYIKALEAGDLNSLPSPVQGRGMLQNYASFIGLDSERLLLRFAEGLQLRQSLKQAARPKKVVARKPGIAQSRLLRLFSVDILVGLLLVTSLVGFVVLGVIQINSMQSSPEPLPTFPSIAESLRGSPDANISTENEEPTTSPPQVDINGLEPAPVDDENEAGEGLAGVDDDEQIPTDSDGAVMVHLVVRQRAWLRVTVDGNVEYEGRVSPGSAYTFSGDQLVRIYTGNGAAIEVYHDQKSLGPLGIYGEVVERVFSAEGAWTPTPSITPIPTRTPTSTPTPSFEGTEEPTLPLP